MFPKGKPSSHCDTYRGLCGSHGFLFFLSFFLSFFMENKIAYFSGEQDEGCLLSF